MSILSDIYFSHPNKPYINHIANMLTKSDDELVRQVKIFHDIGKLKETFQVYIRDVSKKVSNKEHSCLSAFIFLVNSNFDPKSTIFGFLSILSHHREVQNLFNLLENKLDFRVDVLKRGDLVFWEEVTSRAKTIPLYEDIKTDKSLLPQTIKALYLFLSSCKFEKTLSYDDFVEFKRIYSDLIYSDKYEAIFNKAKESLRKIDVNILEEYIENLPKNKKRGEFREFVLNNFEKNHKLFTLTAPTGYGKTLTALNFAMKFQGKRIIFALPFTSIIDQTDEIVSKIYQNTQTNIYKIHHKTTIDESVDEDRYSKVKFLLNSFSGEINITTLYQIIFALFGNKNRDNVKFNQFKNSVIIIDEAQAIPYKIRKDFMRLCEIISSQMDTVFIFMSATMPIIQSDNFKEISNLEYFKEQNRYILKWLDGDESRVVEAIKENAKSKHTLVVVNTVKKAQELFLEFREDFECYSLNGYMTDKHKKETIKKIKDRLRKNEEKILLISTQSIEAGVDLDFEVGFREISPISSIIQTAGRINRHFGESQGMLYIFDDISGYSDLIYGDLQLISKSIGDILKNKDICEEEILEFSRLYFQKIHDQLETDYIAKEVRELAFFHINDKITDIMKENHKELLVIEPCSGFIEKMEKELLHVSQKEADKFLIKDLRQNIIKNITQFGVSISKQDKNNIKTKLKEVKYIKNIDYLPCGATEYSQEYGFEKIEGKKNRK